MKFKTRLFALILTLITTTNALAAGIVLTKQDFSSASIQEIQGQSLIQGILNAFGVEKIQSSDSTGSDIEIHIAGVDRKLKLREPISGDEIQFGPFDDATASIIVDKINGN